VAGQGRAAMLLVVTGDGGLLLHLRDDEPGVLHPGCWSGFGGALEGDETIEEAVRREMREETGVEVAEPRPLVDLVDEVADGGSGNLVSLFYVVGAVRLEDISLQEGAGVGVHRSDQLGALRIAPFVRQALEEHLLPLLGAVGGGGAPPGDGR